MKLRQIPDKRPSLKITGLLIKAVLKHGKFIVVAIGEERYVEFLKTTIRTYNAEEANDPEYANHVIGYVTNHCDRVDDLWFLACQIAEKGKAFCIVPANHVTNLTHFINYINNELH